MMRSTRQSSHIKPYSQPIAPVHTRRFDIHFSKALRKYTRKKPGPPAPSKKKKSRANFIFFFNKDLKKKHDRTY